MSFIHTATVIGVIYLDSVALIHVIKDSTLTKLTDSPLTNLSQEEELTHRGMLEEEFDATKVPHGVSENTLITLLTVMKATKIKDLIVRRSINAINSYRCGKMPHLRKKHHDFILVRLLYFFEFSIIFIFCFHFQV